jgi:hypothetical protein
MYRTVLLASALVVLAAGCRDSDPKDPSPTALPSATQSASVTPEPEVLLGITVQPLTIGDPAPIPDDLMLEVESGCWGCDGPAASLERIYRKAEGTVATEDLFRLPGATIQQPEVDGKYITSMATEKAGDDILVAVCEGPYCGGVGKIADGAKVTVRHSNDGGMTWTTSAPYDGGLWVVANMGVPPAGNGFGLVLWQEPPDYAGELQFYPSGNPHPVSGRLDKGVTILDGASSPPLVLEGQKMYHAQGGTDTNPWFDASNLGASAQIRDFQFTGNNIQVTWTDEARMYTGIGYQGPNQAVVWEAIYRWPDGRQQPVFHRPNGGVTRDGRWVVAIGARRGQVPALVDFDTRTVRPITELIVRGEAGDRLLVKAVAQGPFARVVNAGQGSCVNVREKPSLSANPFTCYPDGVLLEELGQRSEADGHTWTYVMTPSERAGWVSNQYLETSGQAPTLAYYPPGTRTGNVDLDPVIAALETSNILPDVMVGWRKVECAAGPIQGIGGPPACPEGVADKTLIDVIPGGACEGYWHVRGADGGTRVVVGPELRLYAVAKTRPEAQYFTGDYMLIYSRPDMPEFGAAVYVAGGKVTGDWSGCATSPPQMLSQAGAVVFQPPTP